MPWIDRLPGSEFFHAARHVQRRRSLLREGLTNLRVTPTIGEGESDASRLRGLKVFFFVTIVPFFVRSMFALRIDRGTLHRGEGDLRGSGRVRGRWWIYVVIAGRIGE